MPITQHDIGHLLDTAQDLAARVAANADRIDCERQIPPALAEEITDKGFFRLLVPRSLGGAELGHLDFLRILQVFAEVGRKHRSGASIRIMFLRRRLRLCRNRLHEKFGATPAPSLPTALRQHRRRPFPLTEVTGSADVGISALAVPTQPGLRPLFLSCIQTTSNTPLKTEQVLG